MIAESNGAMDMNESVVIVLLQTEIQTAAEILSQCYRNGGKVLLCGNGGSCADAGHVAGELAKGFRLKRPVQAALPFADRLQDGMAAIDLGAQAPLLTAIINDQGADVMFAQQVWVFGTELDVLIGFSTSGTSGNVYNAMLTAKAKGMQTILFTGANGGNDNEALFDVLIQAPARDTGEVQDMHSVIYHEICARWERMNWEV